MILKKSNKESRSEMNKRTIIICAAGCGSRLGAGLPKSLVEVNGRPILEWQLSSMCLPTDRVRIVVGYMGLDVARLAKKLMPSVSVLFNDSWATTKTAASLYLGASGLKGRCVSLDGDLLVSPSDFRALVQYDRDVIGVTSAFSENPVFAELNAAGDCIGFSYDKKTNWEWTGLVNFEAGSLPECDKHVFQMISGHLPMATLEIDCCEVDTPDDLKIAQKNWKSMVALEIRKAA